MKKHSNYYFAIILSGLVMFLANHFVSNAQTKEVLRKGFIEPPPSAMPRTWWHWTKGNVSKAGITKDLEWMKRSGIAGFQLADVAAGMGQETQEKTDFASDKWLDAVRHVGMEADRLDLEMTMFSSAGWSLTGGPWVTPEQAMKKLVWSELQVEGGKQVNTKLPLPPSEIGPFKNLKRAGQEKEEAFYKDVTVIAFRTPTDELLSNGHLLPKITTSSGTIVDSLLLNADLNDRVEIKPETKGKAWITYMYAEPFKARSLTIAGSKGIPYGTLLISNDGQHYVPIVTFPGKQGYRGGKVRTFSFPEVTAKYYRFEFTAAPMTPAEVISEAPPTPDSIYLLSQLSIEQGGRINRWEDKAGFNFLFEYEQVATPLYNEAAYIKSSEVLDISDKMAEDGTLNWQAPVGEWTIMRFGYSLTGAKNRPATPAGLGYEVDKLSKEHTLSYIKTYTGILKKALGDLYGKRLTHLMLDSWEAGIQNWTDSLPGDFQKKRHYSLLPFLPALSGRIVDDPTSSDRFLWDFRRTLVDLFAENHYQVITDYLHTEGLKTYSEAGGVSLESIEDALLNKKYVDIPMGEFWVKDLHPTPMYEEDVKGAVSAAHVYGKKLIAAESFTGGNYESPYTLKKIADYYMAKGINRIVFHTSAHQPLDTKPGNTMVGTHLHRNITWADMAKPFTTYLSRNSYMLQQGLNVADIVYLLPEGAPSTMPFWGEGLQPTQPKGYQFDYINTDALLSRMSVNQNGKLLMPDGTQYGVLVLPHIHEMSLPLIKKIYQLVDSGATIVGPRPLTSPSLTGYPSSDQEIQRLATEIWGDLDGRSRTIRYVGKGMVFWGRSLSEVLSRKQISRDLDYSEPLNGKISWSHRKNDMLDIYFLVNGSDESQLLDLRFRVDGKYPEVWSPDNGIMETVTYIEENGTTRIRLSMQEREAVFVVFSKEKTINSSTSQSKGIVKLPLEWSGSWKVKFPLEEGDKTLSFTELESWTENKDEDVKYYSGTALYSNTFTIKDDNLPTDAKIMLNLDNVRDIAQVSLNGQQLDTLWKAPYSVEISKWLKKGENILEVSVTNQWTNRLVGDKLLPPEQRKLDALIRPFGGEYQLSESGLMGEISLYFVKPETSIILK